MIVEIPPNERDLRDGPRPEIDHPALQPCQGELVLQPPGRQRRSTQGPWLGAQTVIDAEKLPPIRAEGRGARCAGHSEPRMKPARHRLILARQDDPSKRRVRHRKQVEILRHVCLVVAHSGFTGETEILGVEGVDPKRHPRVVAHAYAPRPCGEPWVERERGRRFNHSGNVGRPGDGARSDAPEGMARACDGHGTARSLSELSLTVWPVPDMPSHQQSEQAILGWTGQKLIDQDLTVAQGKQRASRKKLGSEAAGGLEPDQAEPLVVSDRDARGIVGLRVQRTFLAVR